MVDAPMCHYLCLTRGQRTIVLCGPYASDAELARDEKRVIDLAYRADPRTWFDTRSRMRTRDDSIRTVFPVGDAS